MSAPTIDFKSLADHLLKDVQSLLSEWLPGGVLRGAEYCCGSLRGEAGESFKVNINTGAWADFATSERGGDLISLKAAIDGTSQGDAARHLAALSNFQFSSNGSNGAKQKEPTTEIKVCKPPAGTPAPRMWHPQYGDPIASWCYLDAQHEPLFYVARYDSSDGKKIFPWSWNGLKWIMKGWSVPRPLFGLNNLAERPAARVIWAEGEKSAEALQKILGEEFVVITSVNGSLAVEKSDWSPVRGRTVEIWPDADEPGIKAARKIAALLSPHCPSVKIIDVSGKPAGWDAADALAEGWTREQTISWIESRSSVFVLATAKAESPGSKAMAAAAVQVNVHTSAEEAPASKSMWDKWNSLGLRCTDKGPIPNLDNAVRVLENDDSFKSAVWYDEFLKKIFIRWKSEETRELSEIDGLNITVYFQRQLGMHRISKETIENALQAFAHRNVKNEVRDWMEGLKWDGTERLEQFFPDVFGTDDNTYSRAVGKNFWNSMAARVYRPGCQVDNMLILEGAQGIGKNRALRAIGGPYYAEIKDNIMSKDFFLVLCGKLLIEIGELSSFRGADIERIKQIVSSPSDRYRAPYERRSGDHLRSSIFCGSTNEEHYLRDNTGGRRFWPIKCRQVRLDLIESNREQYYAEAVARFKRGETWWEMPEAETKKEQEDRRQADEWEQIIANHLNTLDKNMRPETTITELAVECFNIEIGKIDWHIQRRIGAALRAIGWEKKDKREGGHVVKKWMPKSNNEAPLEGNSL